MLPKHKCADCDAQILYNSTRCRRCSAIARNAGKIIEVLCATPDCGKPRYRRNRYCITCHNQRARSKDAPHQARRHVPTTYKRNGRCPVCGLLERYCDGECRGWAKRETRIIGDNGFEFSRTNALPRTTTQHGFFEID